MATFECTNNARCICNQCLCGGVVGEAPYLIDAQNRSQCVCILVGQSGEVLRTIDWVGGIPIAPQDCPQYVRKTLSLEAMRKYPELAMVSLHPGTVETPLSEPFTKRYDPKTLYGNAFCE